MPVKCLDRRARKSPFLGFVGRQSLPAAETETAASILWFAAIQGIKPKQDLADLAPKGRLISAEALERVVGQIRETQKATRELSGGIDAKFDRFRHGVICSVRYVSRSAIAVQTGRLGPPLLTADPSWNFSDPCRHRPGRT